MTEPYVRAVIAAQDTRTGQTVYQYGWAATVTREFDLNREPPHWTTVEWPGPDEFPERPGELDGKRELTAHFNELAGIRLPLEGDDHSIV